jgi:site-specific DNA recombinase
MKAVAYIRVSTTDQKLSPAAQRERIRAFCAAKGWDLVKRFRDIGITGRSKDRPGLQKALRFACRHKAVVVVYSLSRLTRSAAHAESICQRIEKSGAALASCTEPIDTTTAMGRAFFGVVSVFARLESDLISERVKAVNEDTVARLGYRTQGKQPVGWKIVNGRRVPCERERALLARVSELAGQLGVAEAARVLEAAGEPTINQLRKHADVSGWTPRKVRHLIAKAGTPAGGGTARLMVAPPPAPVA